MIEWDDRLFHVDRSEATYWRSQTFRANEDSDVRQDVARGGMSVQMRVDSATVHCRRRTEHEPWRIESAGVHGRVIKKDGTPGLTETSASWYGDSEGRPDWLVKMSVWFLGWLELERTQP